MPCKKVLPVAAATRPMPLEPTDSELEHLLAETREALDTVRRAHWRLVWIAGGTAPGRSGFVEALATRLGCPDIKVGRRLSERLLELPPRGRAAAAGDQFLDLLLEAGSDLLCLDHLEILFDPVLRLHAVETVRNASRRFVIAAAWPGEIGPDGLAFGPPEHPAHVRISLPQAEIPVITLA